MPCFFILLACSLVSREHPAAHPPLSVRHASRGKGCDAPSIFIFFPGDPELQGFTQSNGGAEKTSVALVLCVQPGIVFRSRTVRAGWLPTAIRYPH
jgi:hypothetical protein